MKRMNFKLIERRKTGKSPPLKISLRSRLETNPNGALKPSEGKGKYETIISYIFRLNAYNYIHTHIDIYIHISIIFFYFIYLFYLFLFFFFVTRNALI